MDNHIFNNNFLYGSIQKGEVEYWSLITTSASSACFLMNDLIKASTKDCGTKPHTRKILEIGEQSCSWDGVQETGCLGLILPMSKDEFKFEFKFPFMSKTKF